MYINCTCIYMYMYIVHAFIMYETHISMGQLYVHVRTCIHNVHVPLFLTSGSSVEGDLWSKLRCTLSVSGHRQQMAGVVAVWQ